MRRYAEEQVLDYVYYMDLQYDIAHCPSVSCELFCLRYQNFVIFGLDDLVLLLWSSASFLVDITQRALWFWRHN